MAKKKKVKTPYRQDNFHHLLFGDAECSNPQIEDCSVEEINQAIEDWYTVLDIELAQVKNGQGDANTMRNLASARREIQILKLQKREKLAKAI